MKMRPAFFAFKIKDAVFIGDGNSPNQLQFLMANKISTIINCAGSEILINSNSLNIRVINFQWLDNDQEIILDQADSNFQSIYYFIEDTHSKLQGVLVCSLRGQSRALTIITAYLIKKYKWSLYKTLEYMNSKRNDFQIRANFLKQLVAFEARLFGKKLKNCTRNWDEQELQVDGQIVKNTYLNSLGNRTQNISVKKGNKKKKSVKFIQQLAIIGNQTKQTNEQDQLTIIELNQIVQKKQKKQREATPKKKQISKIDRPKTEGNEDIDFDFSFKPSLPQSNILGNKERRVITPYRIRRNSEKSDKLKTQPKEDVQFNINLNINSINIISGSDKKKFKGTLQQRPKIKQSSSIFNEEKIKLYIKQNMKKRKRESFQAEPRSLSSFSKRLSVDQTEQKKRGVQVLKSLYSKKQWEK